MKERVTGGGWHGKCVQEWSGKGRWSANDVGDTDDPESMVSVSASGYAWNGGNVQRSRSDVEKMFNGDMELIEVLFRDSAALSTNGKVEILAIWSTSEGG